VKPVPRWGLVVVLMAVLAAYSNHFENGFHFDDYHTITDNAFVTTLHNIPRFFTDAALSSTRPATATYRPVTTSSLAVDYWLGHGFQPLFFHISTFIWFALQLVLMFFLFRRMTGEWTALAAVACYGLHPAIAETVNYIIQRADIYSTLGVVAGLLWFVARPEQRKWGLYLIPVVLGILSKAPALVFPFILAAYVWLFEEGPRRWRELVLPFAVTAAAAILTSVMTPPTFEGGASSGSLYRITQPLVTLHYFHMFFLPTHLTADTDWTYIDPVGLEAIAGYLFVIVLGAVACKASKRIEMRPIAFGIAWFFLALAPTSLMPLAEVTNDHRMFFPFVGLALAVFCGLRLLVVRAGFKHLRLVAAALIVVMAAEAAGTYTRNSVWHTEDSLWADVAEKSPRNARGLMNYGITFANRGDNATALTYMERARALMPDYNFLEMNLGITYGNLGRDREAEEHYQRAIALSPDLAEAYYSYATWLRARHRSAEARTELEAAIKVNPLSFPSRNLLMEIYAEQGNAQALDRLIQETLQLTHNDELARRYAAERPSMPATDTPPAEALLHESAELCRAGKFDDCIAAARQAIAVRPDYAEAYNNIAAASIILHRWDEGVDAAREAVRIRPDWDLAKKNLERALAGKQGGGR